MYIHISCKYNQRKFIPLLSTTLYILDCVEYKYKSSNISISLSLLLSFSLSLSYVPSNKNGIFVPKRSVWLHSYLFVMCIFVLDHIERELLCISTIALGCGCFFGEKQTGKWLVRNFSNTLHQ